MSKKRIVSIVVAAIGGVVLIVGIVFLILRLTGAPAVADGEYLVSKKVWILDDDTCEEEWSDDSAQVGDEEIDTTSSVIDCTKFSRVIWTFTEIGKGTLTTNSHNNEYDFRWAMKDGHLMVQTDWLYELDDEFDYKLDQSAGVLVLSDGENEYRFVANNE